MKKALCSIAAASVATLGLMSTASAWQPLDDCRPTWSVTPSRYHVNENGYSGLDLATVREIFADGFREWERPCCSAWEATEVGLTPGVGEDGGNNLNIFSFRETSWPSNLGDARFVLAVTLTRFQPGRTTCTNLSADMVFNAANNTFSTTGAGRTIDLLAVTVHEQGHWLGLDHTTVSGATMQASYFGVEGRTLHPDDEAGVCALYPQDCACTTDADCEAGEECIDRACQVPPCETNADCADGLECNTVTGDCIVPPCESDADCAGNEICQAGECIREADCSICAACENADDCGGSAFICASVPGISDGFCTKTCESEADCPGDTQCFQVPGEDFAVCLNPQAASGNLCPDDYVCTEDGDLCAGVTCGAGETCDPATGDCVGGGGGGGDCLVCAGCSSPADCGPGGQCASFDGVNGVCILSCTGPGTCPGTNTECFSLQDQGGGTFQGCLNDNAATAGACPSSFECIEESVPSDPCDGVTCDDGESCNPRTGDCEPDGGTDPGPDVDAECPVCAVCETDRDCGDGSCVNLGGSTNVCVLDCGDDSDCPGNTGCFDVDDGAGGTASICLNEDVGSAGVCPADFVCDASAGGNPDDGGGAGGDPDGSGTDDGSDGNDGGSNSGNSVDGCSTAGAGPTGLPLWIGAAGLLWAVSRRRAPLR